MSRPNVVLVFMDDWTHWALTSGQVHTPNLDRLAARGTAFTHAVNQGSWTGAVCVASRAMLVSGRSLFHAQAAVDDSSDTPLLGEVFGAAGYRTFFTGKWHNPLGALRRSYQEIGPYAGAMLVPARLPDGSQDIGRPAPGNTWDPADPAGEGHWMLVDGEVVHSSRRWVDSALGFLDSAAGGAAPFFLHLALHAPHDPRQAPARWLDRYPADEVRLPPNTLPEHPFDQGDHLIRDELLAPFPRTPEAVRLHRREYFAIASHADEQIGRLLDDLDRRGLTGDTIVVFSGDHGLALGEHGLMGKQSLYDHSVRVPLVLAGPGVRSGVRDERLVYQASIFPTLCALTGVPAPATVEFPSLSEAGDDDPVFLAYRHLQRGVRTRRWALIAYAPARRMQLFDVIADPWQTRDLAADPAYRDTLRRLLAELRRRQDELEDPSGGWAGQIDESWHR
ncbi:sulfatase-like hydrolase/transferase [Nonomuraea sp. NPDC002799]